MATETARHDWPFDEAENLAVITTAYVLSEGQPILLVVHDEEDGGWQFLCGATDDPGDGRVTTLRRIYERDPSVGELADLPLGWCAWRESSSSRWQRERGG